jgi:hypothetical protein
MLVKILFWCLVACDVLGLAVFFLLGLAAAGPSKTNPLSVVLLILVLPGMVLFAAILLFVLAKSWLWRGLAFGVAALPLVLLIGASVAGSISMMLYQRGDGTVAHFLAGGMREVEEAVERNDVAGVRKAAASADLKTLGRDGTSILVVAIGRLEKSPGPPEVLRVLLDSGADPNAGGLRLPLTAALMASEKTGLEPLRMLLEAGADPNKPDAFGSPAYFLATGARVDPGALLLLLDRGADLELKARDGATALRRAAISQNWPAALLLLQRGANWRETRMLNGMDFRSKVEEEARLDGDAKGLSDVLRFVHEAAEKPK